MRSVTWIEGEYWTVCTVEDAAGHQPVTHFLDGLGADYSKTAAGLLETLRRIANHQQGPKCLRVEDCHQIEGEIYSLRKGDLRVLWFYHGRRVMVCGHAFIKKGQKTKPNGQDMQAANRAYAAIKGDKL